MKNIILWAMAFVAFLALNVRADIDPVDTLITLDTAGTPKVSYIDYNDTRLKNKINEIKDTVNTYITGGSLNAASLSSTGDVKVTIDSDSNGTNLFYIIHHTGDTLFKVTEDSSFKVFKDGDIDGDLAIGNMTISADNQDITIENQSSGKDITFKVAPPNGSPSVMYFDNSGVQFRITNDSVVAVSSLYSYGNLRVTGITTLDSTTTINDSLIVNENIRALKQLHVDTIVNSGIDASKAVFTDANKKHVSNDITGRGNVVMDTAATLDSATITNATLTSATISGGTLTSATIDSATITNPTIVKLSLDTITASKYSLFQNKTYIDTLEVAGNITCDSLNTGNQTFKYRDTSISMTCHGFDPDPTPLAYITIIGKRVFIDVEGFYDTSDSTGFRCVGLPEFNANMLPQCIPITGKDNDTTVTAVAMWGAGDIRFAKYDSTGQTAWTASGNKGFATFSFSFSTTTQQ